MDSSVLVSLAAKHEALGSKYRLETHHQTPLRFQDVGVAALSPDICKKNAPGSYISLNNNQHNAMRIQSNGEPNNIQILVAISQECKVPLALFSSQINPSFHIMVESD